jgi:O-succinylbenzoate synthase
MILADFDIFTYQLPIQPPLQIGKNILTSREGAIIFIKTDTDIQGFGEAAPLPGLQKESLSVVKKQLSDIKSLIKGAQIQDWFEILKNWYRTKDISSCARFAIESALLNVVEQMKYPSQRFKLPQIKSNKIKVNILATGSKTQILKKLEQDLSANCRSIKVKIGRNSLEEDIDLVRTIDKKFGPEISLRLDANKAWEFEQAITFADAVKQIAIEYIEEPLKDPKKLLSLYNKTDLLIALDESLKEISLESAQPKNWIAAIILKPAVIGSLQKTLQYIDFGKRNGVKTVISDTFHTGVGLSMLIRLASIIDKAPPMGFDTYNWLSEDILVDRLQKTDGCFDLKSVKKLQKNLNFSKLEKIG